MIFHTTTIFYYFTYKLYIYFFIISMDMRLHLDNVLMLLKHFVDTKLTTITIPNGEEKHRDKIWTAKKIHNR